MRDLGRLGELYGVFEVKKRRVMVSLEEFARTKSKGKLAAAALIWDRKGRFLLVRHKLGTSWGDFWVTPGGSAMRGESAEDALRREIREEVGIEVREPKLDLVILYDVRCGSQKTSVRFFQFIARAATLRLRLGRDIQEAKWFRRLPRRMAYREDYIPAVSRLRMEYHNRQIGMVR